MPTETEQRFPRTGHSSQSDIDSLLAELGYHQPPRREEPTPPAQKPEPQPIREAAAPAKKEKPRKKTEPKPEPKPVKIIQEPADPPLLDIPIQHAKPLVKDTPPRKPHSKSKKAQPALLKTLQSALDENIEEIELLTKLPVAEGTSPSEARRHRRRQILYFFIGVFFLFAAVLGCIQISKSMRQRFAGFANNETQKQDFADFLEPVVVMDIADFDSVSDLDPDQILSAAIWDFMIHGDMDKYEHTMDIVTVPAIDIEAHAAKLFGEGLSFSHHTIGTGDMRFYYNSDNKSYNIPAAPSYFSYTPLVEQISKEEDRYTLTVAYKEEVPSWQKHDSAAETAKEMEFVLQELNGAYILRSAKNISTEGTL
ncbi:hypothetical protein [Ruminococcus champanellensis]|uniref:Uncharacterized protein n=1 Tax=Ruminococcus champanellensis (strain DSM 18848 / JCM 17042 / KCTC 15320 / 18P13) TaxID=213810 RepID=D4L9K6_RUMC1|nr:hypothetical protein [Ruminococcus champanellensis]CBL16301.1 hypothetical protein RUM_00200 [Ruminococcus champanellensis 18P13 = JCM 17042]